MRCDFGGVSEFRNLGVRITNNSKVSAQCAYV